MNRTQDSMAAVSITKGALRALLFWASFGVRNSNGGSYGEAIEDVVNNYALKINYKLDKSSRPEWGASLTNDNVVLRIALEESVKLQAHYAVLLNQYDDGRRTVFKNADEWLARLRELKENK